MADELQPRTHGAVTVSEFRARLAEMIGRAERGEEVLISRAGTAVARLVSAAPPKARRLGTLEGMLGADALEALSAAVAAPLSSHDQTALEGGSTDMLGIRRN